MKALKHIKHIFILIVAALLFSFGCGDNSTGSSNDDEDRIVGTWDLVSLVMSTEGDEIDLVDLYECFENVLTFEADGDFHASFTDVVISDTGTIECSADTETGSWESEGGSTYTIHTSKESETRELTFFNNGNSFSFSDTETYEEFGSEATLTFERQ